MSDAEKPADEPHNTDEPAVDAAPPETVETPSEEAAIAEEPATEPSVEASAADPGIVEPEAEPVVVEPDPDGSDADRLETTATADPHTPVWAASAERGDRRGSGKGAANETGEIIKTIVFALLIALVLRVLLFQPFTIPSASMEPNLYEGDYIVVSKWSYGYSKHSIPFSPPIFKGRLFAQAPHRGDIVVFKLPRDDKTDYIKRLIGLPGDRIQMIANKLYLNGQPVEDVVVGRAEMDDLFGPRAVTRVRETLPGGKTFLIQDFGPGGDVDDTIVYEVPQGYYFMMGDNRDNSVDSRYDQSTGVGLVPAENLIGKAQIIMFSWSPGASLLKPVTWFANLRPSRFFNVLH